MAPYRPIYRRCRATESLVGEKCFETRFTVTEATIGPSKLARNHSGFRHMSLTAAKNVKMPSRSFEKLKNDS